MGPVTGGPVYREILTFSLQVPDVLRQLCTAPVRLVPDRCKMVGIPLLEGWFREPYVFFYSGCARYSRLVYDARGLALPFQRALGLYTTITRFLGLRVSVHSLGSDGAGYARHAAIADLQGILIEYLVQLGSLGEMLMNQIQEAPSDIRSHILAKGRIEPNNLPPTFPFPSSAVMLRES